MRGGEARVEGHEFGGGSVGERQCSGRTRAKRKEARVL